MTHWLALDPSDPLLRFEAVRLGKPGDDLWPYLAADPQRVLDVAAFYIRTGMYQDALEVLGHIYPEVDALQREPGDALPQNHPAGGLLPWFLPYESGTAGQRKLR